MKVNSTKHLLNKAIYKSTKNQMNTNKIETNTKSNENQLGKNVNTEDKNKILQNLSSTK